MRENRVFLKTLGGLLPVDVIVRRQDDHFCDPLELRARFDAGRAGAGAGGAVGNGVGGECAGVGACGIAGLRGVSAGSVEAVLGEELKMPTVATWWCGQEKPLSYAAGASGRAGDQAVVPGTGGDPIFGAELSAAEREQLIAKMRAQPGPLRGAGAGGALDGSGVGRAVRCNRGIWSCAFSR